MYSVRGIDGREYGSVDMETLKAWTVAGRIRWDTEIHDSVYDTRIPAGDIAELRALLLQVPPLREEQAARAAALENGAATTPEDGSVFLVAFGIVAIIIIVCAIAAAFYK